ncbi:MAG: hypothetical protein ACFHX7_09235 [Pseudomonadota bacterium]
MADQLPVYRLRGQQRGVCPCCGRLCALTFHHLIPKKLHRRKRFKTAYTREVLALGVYVCRACHDGIHDRFDEMTLARYFSSLSELLADEGLRRHFEWVGRQRIR